MYSEDAIVNERITAFINSLSSLNSEICEETGKKARLENVPIIRKETESLIKIILEIKKPKNILEIGTAVGYSAIFMSENMPDNCTITTIEYNQKRADKAEENFKKAGLRKKIKLIRGDAREVLPDLKEKYDLIFLDASKGQYTCFWQLLMPLCISGSVILTDNVLQDGSIVKSRFLIEQRDRTIHTRMRQFLYDITHSDDFKTSIIPLGDGIAISVKK